MPDRRRRLVYQDGAEDWKRRGFDPEPFLVGLLVPFLILIPSRSRAEQLPVGDVGVFSVSNQLTFVVSPVPWTVDQRPYGSAALGFLDDLNELQGESAFFKDLESQGEGIGAPTG